MPTTEFSAATDAVTAAMTMPLESGEHFGSPVSIGYYPGNNGEIWIEYDGARLNIQRSALKDFIKQLKRADVIAAEQ